MTEQERLIARGRHRGRNGVILAASTVIAVAIAVTVAAVVRGKPGDLNSAAGEPGFQSGGVTAEDLADGQWVHLPTSPLGADAGLAEWTGHELLVFGRGQGENVFGSPRGAAYVPGAGWHLVTPVPAGVGSNPLNWGWAGTDLTVIYPGPGHGIVVAVYLPATGSWLVSRPLRPLAGGNPKISGPDALFVAGKAGDDIVLARVMSARLYAYRDDLATGTWQQAAYPLAPAANSGNVFLAAAAGRLIVWCETGAGSVHTLSAGGAWQAVADWPTGLMTYQVLPAADNQILLMQDLQQPHATGASTSESIVSYLVDPVTLQVRELGVAPPNPDRSIGTYFGPEIWTGTTLIALAPAPQGGVIPPSSEQSFSYYMDALDPASGHWYQLPFGPSAQISNGLTPIWGDGQLFVTNGEALWSLRAASDPG